MTQPDLNQRLDSLIATKENEVTELKQAGKEERLPGSFHEVHAQDAGTTHSS